ncbi:MAG: hypothetical protein ACRDYD_07585 [Acidimicrobiales bacterium]
MLKRLAVLGSPVDGYVARPVAARKEDRARALCLNRLLWDLRQEGVAKLVLESREEHNDRKDQRTIVRAQKARSADPDLSYVFRRPLEEPLLWLADAAASAISASLAEGAGYLAQLPAGQVRLVEIDP